MRVRLGESHRAGGERSWAQSRGPVPGPETSGYAAGVGDSAPQI